MVGMWLAANAPERVDRLVLLCTSAHLPPAEGWRERARAVRAAGTVGAVADAVVRRWVTPAFAAAQPRRVAALSELLAASPPAGYAACCEAIAAMDLRPLLPRIAAPTLVVAGADDLATPPAHAETIAAAIPGARLERLSPMAHLGNVEQPDAVAGLIRDHLDAPAAPSPSVSEAR
jgi:3-oxoadipate enol-lactonase